jgi:hypothetical protein
MKARLTGTLLALGLTTGSALAEETERKAPLVLENAPEGTVLMDNDGGRVQIVPPAAVPQGRLRHHGGPVLTAPEVEVVFLGSAWGEPSMRATQERAIEHLASFGRSREFQTLQGYGLKSGQLPVTRTDDFGDPAKGVAVTDLEIQARLSALGGGKGKDSIYLVLLAPGLESMLGRSTAGRDFLAYHNHFYADGGPVHYAVVPFRAESHKWLSSATAALVQTVVNPLGTAWY